MKRAFVRVLPFVLVASTAAWAAAAWTRAPNSAAETVFHGKGPAGFKLEGHTPTLDVKDDGKTVVVEIGLKELTTESSLRDRHMREKYLEVEKFPTTTLAVSLDAMKIPKDGETLEAQATGKMTLHGVTKDLPFQYKATCKAGLCDVEGTVALLFTDFGIVVPSYLGITVKPDIVVNTKFQVKRP